MYEGEVPYIISRGASHPKYLQPIPCVLYITLRNVPAEGELGALESPLGNMLEMEMLGPTETMHLRLGLEATCRESNPA